MPRHIVCLTFDFDTQSGFIARGMTTPTPLSRGEFGALASRRIIDFLASRAIKATARLTGKKARGYRSPSWDLSDHTIDLLLAHGFSYDSSLMGSDYVPYRARRGDVVKLGEPYHFGEQTRLIEMPISWSLDDYPHFEFVRTQTTILAGMQPARAVLQNWFDEFLYMKKTVDWGVLTYTMHPYVIGRGYRMLALEDMVDRLTKEGATFMTMEDAAREAEKRLPPAKH